MMFHDVRVTKNWKIRKKQEKEGKNLGKRGKIGRFFHFPLLTDRAGYATDDRIKHFSRPGKILKGVVHPFGGRGLKLIKTLQVT